jgi:XTP/dITP diphosphohydrolase
MEQLLIATRNANKKGEFKELLGNRFQISDLSARTSLAVEESGKTFEENAILKAVAVSRDCDLYVVADDSGLEVHSLGGAPGIFSARYAGDRATDQANINKLLRELRNVSDRSAQFRCVVALACAGKLVKTFAGRVEGTIVDTPRGSGGFGYDSIFVPNGFGRTFAEMSPELKNQTSHRAKAIAALRVFLQSQKADLSP